MPNINRIILSKINSCTLVHILKYVYDYNYFKQNFNPFILNNLYIAAFVLEIKHLKKAIFKYYCLHRDNYFVRKMSRNNFCSEILSLAVNKCKIIKTNFNVIPIKVHVCDEECVNKICNCSENS